MSNALEQASKTAQPIKLINRTRRPICFRAEGKTVRLAPGEQSAELAAHCAGAGGIRTLCEKGALMVVTPPPAKGREGAGAAAEVGASTAQEAPVKAESAIEQSVDEKSRPTPRSLRGKAEE